jgi:hypothetical protein
MASISWLPAHSTSAGQSHQLLAHRAAAPWYVPELRMAISSNQVTQYDTCASVAVEAQQSGECKVWVKHVKSCECCLHQSFRYLHPQTCHRPNVACW